jgi:CRP/FNR family transcriptional regulator
MPQSALYAIRAGFMKSEVSYPTGTHVVRFLLPGDVAGLDTDATGVHRSDAVALGDCEVCEIPAYAAEIFFAFSPRLGSHLRSLLAEELAVCQEHSAAIAGLDVKRRIAGFLLELGKRWSARGYSSTAFQLPMSREEIGKHLGTTPETVSRVLSSLHASGWIRLRRGEIEILDEPALAALHRSEAFNPASP